MSVAVRPKLTTGSRKMIGFITFVRPGSVGYLFQPTMELKGVPATTQPGKQYERRVSIKIDSGWSVGLGSEA